MVDSEVDDVLLTLLVDEINFVKGNQSLPNNIHKLRHVCLTSPFIEESTQMGSKAKSTASPLLDRRSIDLSGAQEKEGHFHYKNFLRSSK